MTVLLVICTLFTLLVAFAFPFIMVFGTLSIIGEHSRDIDASDGHAKIYCDIKSKLCSISQNINKTQDVDTLLDFLCCTEEISALKDTFEFQQKHFITSCNGRPVYCDNKDIKKLSKSITEAIYEAEKLSKEIALKLLPYWLQNYSAVLNLYEAANLSDLTTEEILSIIGKEVNL